MTQALIRAVWTRANRRCEYCHMPASKYLGSTTSSPGSMAAQLVWKIWRSRALHCNRRKGPYIAGVDPESGEIVQLFHPRQHRWADHFEWNDAGLIGKSKIGRTTIRVLAMNDAGFRAARSALRAEGIGEWD